MFILLSWLFYFVAASASPLQRRWLAKKKDSTISSESQIHFAFLVTVVISILGLLLPLFKPFQFQGSFWSLVGLSLITGFFGASYFISNYIGQKHVEAGVSVVVLNIYTPVTILLASLFLHEKLTPIQLIGAALLFIGMIIVSKQHKISRFRFDKYFMLMLFSGIALGICLVAERALQKTTGFTAGTLLSWWSQCLFLGVATVITRGKNHYSKTEIAVTGILRYLQSLSWVILIFVVGNLSYVSTVTTFKVVVIFLAAALFLNERSDLKRKLLGSFIAVAGLLLM